MSKLKKVLLMCTAYVLVAALAIGGTVAYLQDSDSDVNVMTLGNVDIEQIEQERDANGNLVDFTQGKPAYPVVSTLPGMYGWADTPITMPNGDTMNVFHPDMKNVVDKFISVKNTGKSDAYVRTIIAIEDPADVSISNLVHVNVNTTGWTQTPWATVTINGTQYSYTVFTYNSALEAGKSTPFSLAQVFLDEDGTNEDCAAFGDTWEILALSQAVQAKGFDSATTALNTAFGEVNTTTAAEWFGGVTIPNNTYVSNAVTLKAALAAGGNVVLTDDIALDEAMTIPADKTVALDLNGKTVSNPNGYAIKNNGNLTIEGDGVIEGKNRAINNTGKLILTGGSYKGSTGAVFNSIWENVVIDGDVHDSNFDCAVTVTGGNINSCKFDSVEVTGGTFTNCTFANPSSNIVFKGGTFDFDPTAEVDSYGNYNVVNNGDGTWTVVPDYQAYVGEVGYFYFDDAINAATDGDTVTIAKDLTRYDGVEIYNKDITIDLNGKTIEVTYGSIIDGCVFKAAGTSDVIIKNGTLIGKNGVATSAESTATITLENVN